MSKTIEIEVPEYREVLREKARAALKDLGYDDDDIDRYIASCNTPNEQAAARR